MVIMALLAAIFMLAPALPPAGRPQAHPALEQEGRNRGMRAPGALSARRLPLNTEPVKSYLPVRAAEEGGPGAAISLALLAFHRKVISPVDGDRCRMAPTCSLYAHQAIRQHGVVLGMILTADRLLHEADEIGRVLQIREKGELLSLDPLEANTYWLWNWLK